MHLNDQNINSLYQLWKNSREILQYNTELLNNPGLDRAWLSCDLAGFEPGLNDKET